MPVFPRRAKNRMRVHHPNSWSCQPSEVRGTRIVMLFLVLFTLFPLGQTQSVKQPSKPAKNANSQGLVARGKYIVEGVAMCGQCHTPRDSAGLPDRSRWLQGAPVWLVSAEPAAGWPLQAPRIAGTPPGNDAELVTLLSTGTWRDGKPLRPPMPQFHDAVSVVAYLKSLGAGPQ
jgi:mono/diheme cytochrome c family protein